MSTLHGDSDHSMSNRWKPIDFFASSSALPDRLAEPTDYVHDLEGFSDEEIRLVMRENALGLSVRRPG